MENPQDENKLIADLGDIKPRAFEAGSVSDQRINKISLAILIYTLFVMFPVYRFLRQLWTPDMPFFELESVVTALAVSVLFAAFARRSMTARMKLN